jgi:hypothetical protein
LQVYDIYTLIGAGCTRQDHRLRTVASKLWASALPSPRREFLRPLVAPPNKRQGTFKELAFEVISACSLATAQL